MDNLGACFFFFFFGNLYINTYFTYICIYAFSPLPLLRQEHAKSSRVRERCARHHVQVLPLSLPGKGNKSMEYIYNLCNLCVVFLVLFISWFGVFFFWFWGDNTLVLN